VQTKQLLLTFDYELFLGVKSGSVNACLIEPTTLLLGVLEKYKIKRAIFFVDTSYLITLMARTEPECVHDFHLISKQLVDIVEKGHYVFPHIHPHWLDAKYVPKTNEWSLIDYSKYRFHNTPTPEKDRLFRDSIAVLKTIFYKTALTFKINGYRAGGWSIQPFEDFRPFFSKYDISHEFSVLPGFKNTSDAQYFDFMNYPDKPVYSFENDPCISEPRGSFREYTISSLVITPLQYWLDKIWNKFLWKTGQRSIGNGSGVVSTNLGKSASSNSNKTRQEREMLSMELLTLVKLPLYKSFLKNNRYMHFISHPKMLSHHNLKCFENFLNYAVEQFELQTDFLKMHDTDH